MLVVFLCLSSGSFALHLQDSIKHIEIKIILKEKAKKEANYDSIYRANDTSGKAEKDSIALALTAPKALTTKSSQKAPDASKEERQVLNKFEKEIDTQIETLQQKILTEKTQKDISAQVNSSIKETMVKDRITFIQIGFLIFIAGLFLGLKFNKAAFSISAIGAFLIVVALYI